RRANLADVLHHLALVGAVVVHHKHGHAAAFVPGVTNQFPIRRERWVMPFAENFFAAAVGFDARHLRLDAVLAEDDALAARGLLPAWHVANGGRAVEPPHFGAVDISDPKIRRALAVAHETHALSVRRPAGVTVLGRWRARDVLCVARFGIDNENF